MISCVLALHLANLVDLSAIASLGSVVALGIFLIVSIAALRMRTQTGSTLLVVLTGIAATAVALVVFGVQTAQGAPGSSGWLRSSCWRWCSTWCGARSVAGAYRTTGPPRRTGTPPGWSGRSGPCGRPFLMPTGVPGSTMGPQSRRGPLTGKGHP